VDTVSRGGAPGTLYTIEPDLEDLEATGQTTVDPPGLDPHSMDPLHVLRAVKAMGGPLGRILLIGCEPADLGGEQGRMGLTPPVSAAIEQAVEMVESLIAKELEEVLG
jgi:hydrogenase maturation protease